MRWGVVFGLNIFLVINQSDQHTDGEAKCKSLTVQNGMIIKMSIFLNTLGDFSNATLIQIDIATLLVNVFCWNLEEE